MNVSVLRTASTLRWWPVALLLWIFLAPSLGAQQSAQQTRQVIFHHANRSAKNAGVYLQSTNGGIALNVDMKTIRSTTGPDLFISSMPLASGVNVDLDLREYTIITPDATLTSTGAHGVTTPLPQLSVRLYRGKVAGDMQSNVYLAFSAKGVIGTVTTGGTSYEIATDQGNPSTENRIAAVVFPSSDLAGRQVSCGVNDQNMAALERGDVTKLMSSLTSPLIQSSAAPKIEYLVRGAYDADYEYLQLFNGDKQAAADYLVSVVGQVGTAYETDLGCQIVISYMNLWDTPDDPFIETGTMQLALEEARNWWLINRDTVTRGFTNIFSGKPWSGIIGIAYLGGLCYHNPSIGVVGITRTNPAQDYRVSAHETGHIFGSKHTHDCGWPGGAIDSCAAAEGGSCFGATKQRLGTIMSYCNQSEMKFDPTVASFLIGVLKQGLPCVDFSRKLTVKPTIILFPEVSIDVPIDTVLDALYRNEGSETVTVLTQTLSGPNVDKFTILSQSPPFTIPAGDSAVFRVRFLSSVADIAQAVLTITHDGLNPPVSVTFEAYAKEYQPRLGFIAGAMGEVNWGQRIIGERADTVMKNFYANLGDATLYATKAQIVGPDRFEFQVLEGTAPFELLKTGKLTARLRFAPQSEGIKTAYLRVESNTKNKFDSIPLRGNVRKGPRLQLKVNDLAIDYRDRNKAIQYDTTFDQFFYNAGTDTLQVVADLEGPDADLFISNELGIFELAPGESRNLTFIFFVPHSVPDGQKRAELILYTSYGIIPLDTIHIHLLGRVGLAGVPWESQQNAGIRIAPNPTTGDADIQISPLPDEMGAQYTVRITDAIGREIDRLAGTFSLSPVAYQLKGENLASGIYYISVATGNGTRVGTVTVAR